MSEPANVEPAQRRSFAGGAQFWVPTSISLFALIISAVTAFSQRATQKQASASELHDLHSQAEEHLERGEVEEARRDIRAASIKAPRNYKVWVLQGRHRALIGDEGGAVDLLRQAIQKEPEYAPAHFYLARVLRDRGELENALHHLEKSLSISQTAGSDIGQAILYVNIGDVFYSQRELDKAKNSYREALELDPVNPDAHARLGEMYVEERRFEDAIKAYGHAISADPENAEHLRGAALVFYYDDDFERAEALVRRSLEERETPAALELLALILEDQGKDSELIRARLEGLRTGSLWLESAQKKAPQADAGGENGREIAQ